ncbi:MAG TPA: hypothetical protein VLB27_01945, partial [candidate division Zixibacteria bacterium]|nr:hypothetical protein [candidate division Zixibacteria bacterium]
AVRIQYVKSVKPNVSQVRVPLRLITPADVLALNMPLRLRVDGAIPTIDSAVFSSVFADNYFPLLPDTTFRVIPEDGVALIATMQFVGSAIPPGVIPVGDLYLTITPSASPQTLTIEWTTLSPIQAMHQPYPDTSLYPLIVSEGAAAPLARGAQVYLPQYTPVLEGVESCCLVAGDADNSGAFNISDVTFGIGYIFSGGPAPVCQDQADANGDNSFNISDVTYGIGHIFSSGPAPICGTTGL